MPSAELPSGGGPPKSRAAALFAQFLAGGGDQASFERFAAAQPAELRAELGELWHDYVFGAKLMRGLAERPVAGCRDPIALLRSMCRTDASATYRAATPLAEGGMSQIELVEDSKLGRQLVRKVLPVRIDGPPRPGDRRRVLRFLNEVRITSGLQHPAIPTLVEVGIDERGAPFFTMPRVRGEDLAAILVRHRAGEPEWTRARVLQVLVDVCGALAYAHSRGVVHRDIKPENIMVGRFGETLVMDWGLAKHVDDRASDDAADADPERQLASLVALADVGGVTVDGDVVGTPAFMAPEQAVGDLEDVGPATDQYALGAILYTLLSGQRPYADTGPDATPREVVREVRNRAPTPLSELAPSAPVELVAIAERAMARRPEQRYADVTALAADLRAFLHGRAVSAYDTGGWTLLRLWVRRNRRLSAAIAAAGAILIGALVWINIVDARYRGELRATNAELTRAHGVAAERIVDMERNLYYHTITSVAHQLEVGEDYGHLRALLEGCPPELRDWEWRFLGALRDSSARRAPLGVRLRPGVPYSELRLSTDERLLAVSSNGDTTEIRSLASPTRGVVLGDAGSARFAPGSKRVAVLRSLRYIDVRSVSTGEHLVTIDAGQRVSDYCWARGGGALAVAVTRSGAAAASLRSYDAAAGRLLAAREHIDATILAASSDGDKIAAGSGRAIRVFGAADLGLQAEIECPADRVPVALAFSSGGRRLIAVFGDRHVVVYDAADGGAVATRALPGDQTVFPWSVTIDGRELRVAYVDRGALCVYSIAEERLLARRYGGDARLSFPAFVREPPGVLALANQRELRQWASSEQIRTQLPDYGAEVLVVAVSPDGRRVAATGWRDETCVWDLRRGGAVDLLPGSARDPKRVLAFSPDGERLLVEGPRGRPVIWQLAPRRIDRELDVQLSWAGSGAWSPDGRWVWVTNAQNRFAQVDLETGRLVVTPYAGRKQRMAFSPDGRCAYLPADDALVAVDNASLRELWRTRHPASSVANSVACTADGAWLAAGYNLSGRIALLDAATGETKHSFTGHRDYVNGLAFSPSGKRLLSISYDGTIKVWEPFAQRQLLRLEPDGQPLQDLAFSPDGRLLVAAGVSGTVHVWRLP